METGQDLSQQQDTDVIPPLAHNGNIYYANKERAIILNDFFIAQSTLEHEDTPPDLLRLDCQINDIGLRSNRCHERLR